MFNSCIEYAGYASSNLGTQITHHKMYLHVLNLRLISVSQKSCNSSHENVLHWKVTTCISIINEFLESIHGGQREDGTMDVDLSSEALPLKGHI